MIAQVIKAHRKDDTEQTALVIHDWGSVVGIQLQRLFPSLVSRMVVCDVGPTESVSNVGVMLFAGECECEREDIVPNPLCACTCTGLYYQWVNSLAFWLWRAVPVVGEYLGDAIHRMEVRLSMLHVGAPWWTDTTSSGYAQWWLCAGVDIS